MTRAKPKTFAPDDLTREERRKLLAWIESKDYLRALAHNKKLIRLHVDECLSHHRSAGTLFSNWVAACQKWIVKAERWKTEGVLDEQPKDDGKRDYGFSKLSETLKVIKGERQ